ncbi:MAG: phage tail protein [Ignavibacteriota bacterium]
MRKTNGASSVVVTSRSIASTPNSMSVEFQDALNGYQQDSYEMVDPEDVALTGQTTSAGLMALGLPQFDQASRILKFNLDKSVRGNTYIAFQSSIKAFGISPGDIITVTYLKEGFLRQPFRVVKLSPATNFRITTISAQIHDDGWYADTNGQAISATGQILQDDSGVGLPNPLLGSVVDGNGDVQFGIVEMAVANSDGHGRDERCGELYTASDCIERRAGHAAGQPVGESRGWRFLARWGRLSTTRRRRWTRAAMRARDRSS